MPTFTSRKKVQNQL